MPLSDQLRTLSSVDLGKIRKGDMPTVVRVIDAEPIPSDAYYGAAQIVIALYPSHPAVFGDYSQPLATTLAILHRLEPAMGHEQRLEALLNATDLESMVPALKHTIKAAAKHNLPIAWDRLVADLARWDNAPDRTVQQEWAKAFWAPE